MPRKESERGKLAEAQCGISQSSPLTFPLPLCRVELGFWKLGPGLITEQTCANPGQKALEENTEERERGRRVEAENGMRRSDNRGDIIDAAVKFWLIISISSADHLF